MIYPTLKILSRILLKACFSLSVYGQENIPKQEAFIVAANHASFLDPVVVSVALPQRVYWVALRSLYKNRFLAAILRLTECVPVNGATRQALEALSAGKVIGVFPEGTRTSDGRLLQKGKNGAAILAMRAGVKVVPAGIKGTYRAYPRTAVFPRPYPVSITFGRPLEFGRYPQDTIDAPLVEDATATIMSAIGALLKTMDSN